MISPTATVSSRRSDMRNTLSAVSVPDRVLAAAVVIQAAALVGWTRVITVDGPAHLASAAALLRAGEPSHAVYDVDLTPVPNMLATLLLAALLGVVGPDGAERALVLAYAAALPLAMRYALRGVDERAGWLAVAAVPFVAGYLYTYGFYNLCLALVGMLVVTGLALRRRTGWSVRSTAGLAAALLVTWSAHLLPLLVAGLLVAVLAVCRATVDGRSGASSALARHVGAPLLAGLPVLGLTVAFWIESAASRGAPVHVSSVGSLALGLRNLGRPLVAWTVWEYAVSTLVAVGLGALAVRSRAWRDRSPERLALAVTTVLITGWYLISPDRYGPAYGFLNDRLSLFPPLLLALWSASPPPSPRSGRTAVALLLVAAAGLIALRLPTDLRYQRDVAELVSVAPHVPRGATLVTLRLWRDAPVGPDARNRARDPLRHQGGRVAVLRDGVDVGHYQAITPYFPVRFRSASNPRAALDPDRQGLEQVPPRVDLTWGPDVVLLVGRSRATPEVLASPGAAALLADVSSSYRRVATSAPSGLVEVWHRRTVGARASDGKLTRRPGPRLDTSARTHVLEQS